MNVTLAPLYLKYETKENCYLYDAATGRIIRVDPVIYAIIDEVGILTDEEIRNAYRDLGDDEVRTALSEIEDLQKRGYLREHRPLELSRVDRVSFDGEKHDIRVFWRSTALLLILGITERCNLNCKYCCFSGHFAGQRIHSSKTMPREVAERAISYYLENELAVDGFCPITFYGGEALLESHVFKECVFFAETRAAALGKKIRFAVTTNGTLLDDGIVDFLVEHDFLVIVSLDGPRESHDRYRTFPNGKGSFDVVVGHLRRFAKRYPDYKRRGLNMTLAPPFDLEATSRILVEFLPDYPATKAGIVNTGTETEDTEMPTRYGCFSTSQCRKNFARESFRHFDMEDRRQLHTLWKECVDGLAQWGVMKTAEKMPLAMLLFEGQIGFYHRRNVMDHPPDWSIYVPCIPGFTRRFCDVDGNYRVCERVDDSEAYRLGNVWDGPDCSKMKRTMDLRRHFGDCGNCPSLKVCDICYARIPGSDAAHSGFDPWFDKQCRQTRKTSLDLLQAYTEIMESNPDAFDRPKTGRDLSYKEILFCAPTDPAEETVDIPVGPKTA